MPPLTVPLDANKADIQPLGEDAQAAFFNTMVERAELAADRVGARVRHLDLGGQIFRLIFAGPALEDFAMPALAHLETAACEPDATFRIWDGAQSGVAMIDAPCGQACLTDRGDIWGMASRRYRSAFRRFDSSVSVFDARSGIGVYWVSGRDSIPPVDRPSPFRILFGWAVRARERYVVPAAAIAINRRAALLLGDPATRSAIAAGCAEAGLGVLGDRYVVVAAGADPSVLPLYGTASPAVEPDAADLFRTEVPIVPLVPAGVGRPPAGVPIDAILSCDLVPGAATRVLPADPTWMALATAYATIAASPGADDMLAAAMADATSAAGAGFLRFGDDLAAVPEAIREALTEPALPRATAVRGRHAGLSVIVPVHNGAHFLLGAVGSILAEAPDPLDLVVVDDGSADDIEAAVAALPVAARLLRQPNLGPAAARNLGLAAARFDTIGFLDVDDLWPAGRLAALWAEFAHRPDAAVARGHAQLFRAAGPDGRMEYLGAPAEAFPDYIGAGLFRRAAFDRIGTFDAALRFGEDSDWFNRAKEAGVAVTRAPIVSLLVRRHAGNMTRGRSPAQLNQLRVFHRQLERRRKRETLT